MVNLQENHILSKDEVAEFKQKGFDLDENQMHIIRFGFNDKWNNAADPRPFRVKTEHIETLAKDAVGMPYIVNPNGNKMHIRGTTEGKKDTALDLLSIQAKYAIGTIKAPLITEKKNVYFIIGIWPEYEKLITEKRIPEFTSITLQPIAEDAEGISEAAFLNINGVETPGYDKILAGTLGVCKGGIKKCMDELAPLAAAGKLNATRENAESFSILQGKIGVSMSADQSKATPSLETVVKDVEGLKSEVSAIRSDVGAIRSTVEAFAKNTGADDKKPVGAAGDEKPKDGTGQIVIPKELENNEFVKSLADQVKESSKSLEQIKLEREAEKKKQAEQTRQNQAKSIVSYLIKTGKVKKEDEEKEIKKYFELKDESGNLKDLEVLDNFLKSQAPAKSEDDSDVLGAAGDEFPEIHGDRNFKPTITNAEALNEVFG